MARHISTKRCNEKLRLYVILQQTALSFTGPRGVVHVGVRRVVRSACAVRCAAHGHARMPCDPTRRKRSAAACEEPSYASAERRTQPYPAALARRTAPRTLERVFECRMPAADSSRRLGLALTGSQCLWQHGLCRPRTAAGHSMPPLTWAFSPSSRRPRETSEVGPRVGQATSQPR